MVAEDNIEVFIKSRQGKISTTNERLINQSQLGLLFPEFIPQLVIGNDSVMKRAQEKKSYPQQYIEGISWSKFKERTDLPLEVSLQIASTSTNQLSTLLDDYGILLWDRSRYNIKLSPSEEKSNIFFDNKYWRVWQLDTEFVYDCLTDEYELTGQDNLKNRNKPFIYKNPLNASQQISDTVLQLLEGVIDSGREKEASESLTVTEQRVQELLKKQRFEVWRDNNVVNFHELHQVIDDAISIIHSGL